MPYFSKCEHHAAAGVGDWCLACVNAGKAKDEPAETKSEPKPIGRPVGEVPFDKAAYIKQWEEENRERRTKYHRNYSRKRRNVEVGKFVIYNADLRKWKKAQTSAQYRWTDFTLATVYKSRGLAEMACRKSQDAECVAMKQMDSHAKTLKNWSKETEAETLAQIEREA